MENWIKIYEEPIGNSLEGIDVENYKIWLNDILEDEAIPYKNSIRYDSGIALSFADGAFVIEVHIYEKDAIIVKELIEKDVVEAHRVYAREIVRLYHGQDYIKEAEENLFAVGNTVFVEGTSTVTTKVSSRPPMERTDKNIKKLVLLLIVVLTINVNFKINAQLKQPINPLKIEKIEIKAINPTSVGTVSYDRKYFN